MGEMGSSRLLFKINALKICIGMNAINIQRIIYFVRWSVGHDTKDINIYIFSNKGFSFLWLLNICFITFLWPSQFRYGLSCFKKLTLIPLADFLTLSLNSAKLVRYGRTKVSRSAPAPALP